MKTSGAQVGIAYDGDADRIGAVDEHGRIVWGDEQMVVYARSILKEHPGATIIGDVKCSQRMYDDIARHGGRPIMWKTGHSLIKSKLKEENAALAGEMSGHMFFNDRYYGFDDAIYASFRLLEISAARARGWRELLADLPQTCFTPELRLDCPGRPEIRGRAQGGGVLPRALRHDRYRRRAGEFPGRMGAGASLQYAAGAGDALRGARPEDARRDPHAVRRQTEGIWRAGLMAKRAMSEAPSAGAKKKTVPKAAALIIAGGRGTRFWPESRAGRPKPLFAIDGKTSLLEETIARTFR